MRLLEKPNRYLTHHLISKPVFNLLFIGEFTVYLQYVRALGFFDSPDYDFLSSLFQGLLESMEIPCDWNFDWMNHTLVSLEFLFESCSILI